MVPAGLACRVLPVRQDRKADATSARTRTDRMAALGRDLVAAAYLEGDFVLASGKHSRYYFDKYLFETQPSLLGRLAEFLAEALPPDTERLAGPELGAVALAAAVSLRTGLPFVIVKKQSKDYGTRRSIEGELNAGDRVTVVEDILTTGAAAVRAADAVTEAGGVVLKIVAVVDREEGAAENIAAAGYQYEPLFRRSDLGV
jgi:orotate phosphoribosyltransferase